MYFIDYEFGFWILISNVVWVLVSDLDFWIFIFEFDWIWNIDFGRCLNSPMYCQIHLCWFFDLQIWIWDTDRWWELKSPILLKWHCFTFVKRSCAASLYLNLLWVTSVWRWHWLFIKLYWYWKIKILPLFDYRVGTNYCLFAKNFFFFYIDSSFLKNWLWHLHYWYLLQMKFEQWQWLHLSEIIESFIDSRKFICISLCHDVWYLFTLNCDVCDMFEVSNWFTLCYRAHI